MSIAPPLGGVPLRGDDRDTLTGRLDALTDWLQETQRLWAHRPFVELPAPWEADLPDVACWLRGLDDDALTHLERGVCVPDMPPAFARLVETAADWAQAEALPESTSSEEGIDVRRPGMLRRKADQVHALSAVAAAAADDVGASRVVDWCAGKGHLGRAVAARTGCPLTTIERDPALSAAGQVLALDEGIACREVNADVHVEPMERHVARDAVVVALHACGILTDHLIEQVLRWRPAAVVLSPCCYHRGHESMDRVPTSAAGRRRALTLDHNALRLTTLDEGPASPGTRARRHREQVWRLALDLLIREGSGRDTYTPVGRLPSLWFREPFERFVAQVAARDGLPLPAAWEPERALAAGQSRAHTARALGAMRAQFRRPLERWLLLDRAQHLAEGGYEVSVGTYCDRQTTPRNLALVARRGRLMDT